MTLALELTIRLLSAGVVGGAIGYEREFRGKGAGVRTHVLVALGASLFMIISQYGFAGAERFDAARIAAGVVGGLGFLGGGIIMKNKHVVGLTTAAGIWVTGAIGLALGSGLYELAILCAIMLMGCMEAMHFYSFKYGERQTGVVLTADDSQALENAIQQLGKRVNQCSLSRQGDRYKAELSLLIKKRDYPMGILKKLRDFPGVELETLD